MSKGYLNVTPSEHAWLEQNWRILVNTGGNSLEHVLGLLQNWRRPNNRDLNVNLPRYLLGYGIHCQVIMAVRMGFSLATVR